MPRLIEVAKFYKLLNMNDTNYRPQIDGLRAIAVLAVVIFHAFPMVVPGGFVGVDIFFVISGFLITRIIHQEIAADNFSIKRFYLRRIKRILPAYIVVSTVVLIVASLLLVPDDYTYFTTSLAASWGFASNVFFSLLSGGYFSQRTETFPLLHTWSLSVEEQFYFVFPLILYLIRKSVWQHLFAILVGLFFIFLALSEYGSRTASGFYLLQYRAHELLLGGLTYFFMLRYGRESWVDAAVKWVPIPGLILTAYALFAFSGKTPFPGVSTLVPCLGAAFILLASNVDGGPNRILSASPMVFVGKISYSFYLWHWPIFAFMRVYEIPFSPLNGILAIALSVVLAYFSWRFVENPIRLMKIDFKKAFVFLYIVPAFIFIGVGAISYKTKGLPTRFPADVRALMSTYGAERELSRTCSIRNEDEAAINLDQLLKSCRFGAKADALPEILLFGDSHASHFKPFVNELASEAGLGAVYHVQGNCNSIDLEASAQPGTSNPSCRKRNDQLYELAGKFKYVVLASNWRYKGKEDVFEKQLDFAVDRLVRSSVNVVLFKDNAGVDRDLSRCVLNVKLGRLPADTNCHLPSDEVLASQGAMDSVIDRVAARHANVIVVEPKKVMCDQRECLTHADNVAYYRDSNHLNEAAALALGRRYAQVVGNPFKN